MASFHSCTASACEGERLSLSVKIRDAHNDNISVSLKARPALDSLRQALSLWAGKCAFALYVRGARSSQRFRHKRINDAAQRFVGGAAIRDRLPVHGNLTLRAGAALYDGPAVFNLLDAIQRFGVFLDQLKDFLDQQGHFDNFALAEIDQAAR